LFIKYRKGVIAILIIDRIEGNWVVIEFEGETFNIPKSLFPRSAREGDVIKISVSVDDKATSERRNRVEKLMDELFED
jgi:hypothetical protein